MEISRKSIYPSLEPTAPILEEDEEDEGQNFRLTKINEVHQFLENEQEKRSEISKKYRKVVKAIDGTNAALVGFTTLAGATGAVLLATVVAIPVAVILESLTCVTGALSCLGTILSRRLLKKSQKHEKLAVLACSKLNSISNHVSQALDDNDISHDEFKLIMEELEKYKTLKLQVRAKTQKDISEDEKKDLIAKGREEAKELFLNTLNNKKKPKTTNIPK